MQDRVKLPLLFDPKQLEADLDSLQHIDWIDHFVKENYDGSWSVIPLRGPAGETHPIRQIYSDPGCTEFADTAYLQASPYFQEVLASIPCPLNAVRLMKLTPGSEIKEHIDFDLSIEDGTARLHVPITTNPKVEFFVNKRQVTMNAGECWYLRLSDPHSVRNPSDEDRVHLVIDASVNDWLRRNIESATVGD